MSSPPGGDALAPASTVPPTVNTSDSSSQQVNGTTSSAGPPAPVILLSPLPAAGNGSVSSPPPPGSGSSNKNTLVALGVGIGIGGAIVLVCVGIFVLWYKRRKRRLGLDGVSHAPLHGPKDDPIGHPQYHWQQNAPPLPNLVVDTFPKPIHQSGVAPNSQHFLDGSTPPPPFSFPSSMSSDHKYQRPLPDSGVALTNMTFTYGELALATDEFSSTNLLGQGGFGYVIRVFSMMAKW